MITPKDIGFFALFLGVLVFVHELGHFLVAKWLNVKVLRFSIGFGPKIIGFTRGETEYRIAWVPLGGYVKMAGEQPYEELPPEEAKRGFLAQPPWKRALIVVAGPAFNLIFPVLAFFLVFWGDHKFVSNRVASVEAGFPAAVAQLEVGDKILSIDGTPIETFDQVQDALRPAANREVTIVVDRDGQRLEKKLVPTKQVDANPIEKVTRGMIGISAMPHAPILGVPAGSSAETAGLKTFDRVLSIDGVPVKDETDLKHALAKNNAATIDVTVARRAPLPAAGVAAQTENVVKVTVPRQPGTLYDALGAEHGDVYVDTVLPGSPAEKAGIKPGDRLVEIEGRAIASWPIFANAMSSFEGKPFTLKWKSGGELKEAQLAQVKGEVHDEYKNSQEVWELGIVQAQHLPEALEAETITQHWGPDRALVMSLKRVPEIIGATALVIGKLFTGSVPLKTAGGPIMVFQIATKTAEEGFNSYVTAMAVLSINLGLMNLLPIPVLDGFHLIAAIWEGARRRPIPLRAREVANIVGLVLLAVLMIRVFWNDITKLGGQ